jgi:geranylgeranyl reductase family protein
VGTPREQTYDTVVAGAGPAGIMAAYAASRGGAVLLVDASELPRDKSCGGMLHEITQAFLEPYGTLPEEIILSPRHVHFRYHDWDRGIRKVTTLRFVNVDRAGFDDWLLRTVVPSDVEVVESCAVESFAQDGDGVSVVLKTADGPMTVSCKNLIGADGGRSSVRRALGIGVATTYVTLQDYVTLEGEIEPFFDCVYMRNIGDDFAYTYVVPKGDRAAIGSVFYPKTKRPWEMQDQVIETLRKALPQLGESVKREAAAALYVRSSNDTVAGAGRVLLAGEAGGFMSPTSGEGISYALESGLQAGIAVADSAPGDALAAYRRASNRLAMDIRRRLRWLPVMESPTGKYIAGFMPERLVDRVTQGL